MNEDKLGSRSKMYGRFHLKTFFAKFGTQWLKAV